VGFAVVALAGARRGAAAAGAVCPAAASPQATATVVALLLVLSNDLLDGNSGARVGAAANVHGLCVLLLQSANVLLDAGTPWKLQQLGALVMAVAAATSIHDGDGGDDGDDGDGGDDGRQRWRRR